jgi:hypothetical protein
MACVVVHIAVLTSGSTLQAAMIPLTQTMQTTPQVLYRWLQHRQVPPSSYYALAIYEARRQRFSASEGMVATTKQAVALVAILKQT